MGRSGLTHAVAVSALQGSGEADGPMVGLREMESLLSELDLDLLVLRPTAYMDYLLAALPMIRSQRINGSALAPDLPFPMIATADVAEVAARNLISRDFTGHSVRALLGPEEVTMAGATRLLGERLGIPDLPYLQFPPEEVEAALRQGGMSSEVAGLVVRMQLSMNRGLFAQDIVRGADTQTPTRFSELLDAVLAPEKLETDPRGALA